MSIRYRDLHLTQQPHRLQLDCSIENRGRDVWRPGDGFSIGWQIYDPVTGVFLSEGEWQPLSRDIPPRDTAEIRLPLHVPDQPGEYRIYVSPIDPQAGWFYERGEPLIAIDVEQDGSGAAVRRYQVTTLRRLRLGGILPAFRRMVRQLYDELWNSRNLIASLVKREISARYRGSFGDSAWAVLHPILMMATYFFVFGVVLQTRFANDPSRTGFALYFLAGMLPWLAFADAVARAPELIVQNRVFVKKLVFPVSILPFNSALAGLVTGLLATFFYLIVLAFLRDGLPLTALALPLLILPQFLFTAGVCWMLAALGVFLRDLSHMMSFLLTVWMFITPIFYPETSLPVSLIPILAKNPLFQLVRMYRQVLLEGQWPDWWALGKLWLVGGAMFCVGYAWFHRLRRTFADVA